MDLSKEYILMCEKAEEIQRNHSWEIDDYIHWRTLDKDKKTISKEDTTLFCLEDEYCQPRECGKIHENRLRIGKGKNPFKLCSYSQYIWLPRQDQLQEMIDCSLWEKLDNLRHELDMCVNRVNSITLEKAWLFYIMRRNFRKVWTGKDWIKAGEL